MKLSEFGRNKYSQFGEDGIIEKIFEIIGPSSKTCVEFGAWDGFYLSNTANLWTNGWKGILIEGDKAKGAALKENLKPYNCVAICRYVGISNDDSLERILEENNITDQIDLLSIDIDGDDYHVLSSLNALRPRVIICEYNHTIPSWIDVYQKPGEYFGASAAALCRIAKEKGYSLVAITDGSCFFVQNAYMDKFKSFNTDLHEIATQKYLNYIFTDYSGKYLVYGAFSFGLNRKYRLASIVHKLDALMFKEKIFIINFGDLRSILASFYRSFITPILKRSVSPLKKG